MFLALFSKAREMIWVPFQGSCDSEGHQRTVRFDNVLKESNKMNFGKMWVHAVQ